MKRLVRLLLLVALPACAQSGIPSWQWVNVAPSGPCPYSPTPIQILYSTGQQFACLGGSWIAITGGSGAGTGTVTSVSLANANGVSGTVANPNTTPNLTLVLGAINPSSIGQSVPGPGSFTTLSSSLATGITQCAQFNSAGQIAGTGSPCGGGLPTGSTNQLVYYPTNGNTVSPLNLGSGLSISSGTLNTTQLPSGTTNQLLYYAANGATVTPLTLGSNLSITSGTLNASGGGGSFSALTGDATSTSTGGSTTVVGLKGNILPSLTTGYLNWTGSAWALTAGGSGSTPNPATFNNSGAGAASGSTFNGSSALTVSYNTLGASPAAGSTSLTTLGTITTGTWNAVTIGLGFGGTAANTAPSGVANLLGNPSAGTYSILCSSTSNCIPSSATTPGGSAGQVQVNKSSSQLAGFPVYYADAFSGSDCGAQVAAALTAIGSNPGNVEVSRACGAGGGVWTTAVTVGSNQHLRVRAGVYSLGAVITLGANATVECDPVSDVDAGTGSCIFHENNGVNLAEMILLSGNYSGISNLTFDGNYTNNTTAGSNVMVTGLRARLDHINTINAETNGIFIGAVAQTSNVAAAAKLDHVFAVNNHGDGIACSSSSDLFISDESEIENNGGNGISFYNCGGSRISGNDISGNALQGIYVHATTSGAQGGFNINIVNNFFSNQYQNDIYVQGWDSTSSYYASEYNQIVGNIFQGSANHGNALYDAIKIQDSGNNTITGNTLQDLFGGSLMYRAGIELITSASPGEITDVVSGNTIGTTTPIIPVSSTVLGANNFGGNVTTNGTPSTANSFAPQITTAYTNATTTFSNLSGMAWPLVKGQPLKGTCWLVYSTSAATAYPQIQFTGPASPTFILYSSRVQISTTAYSQPAVATAFSTALVPSGTGTASTLLTDEISFGVVNGSTAGTVQLQAAAAGTGTLTIYPGSWCRAQ